MLPTDILGHILRYVDPETILTICVDDIYPLKSAVYANRLHVTDEMIAYLKTHPYNNLYFRYNIDMTPSVRRPLYATAANLRIPVSPQIRPHVKTRLPRPTYTTERETDWYLSEVGGILETELASIYDKVAECVSTINTMIAGYELKLDLLQWMQTDLLLKKANTEIARLRKMYEIVVRSAPVDQCACGNRRTYYRKNDVDVVIGCSNATETDRRSVSAMLRSFVRATGPCRMSYGKHAGRAFTWVWQNDVPYCRRICRRTIRPAEFVPKKQTFKNYIYAVMCCGGIT